MTPYLRWRYSRPHRGDGLLLEDLLWRRRGAFMMSYAFINRRCAVE
jgi:hypothetical protein